MSPREFPERLGDDPTEIQFDRTIGLCLWSDWVAVTYSWLTEHQNVSEDPERKQGRLGTLVLVFHVNPVTLQSFIDPICDIEGAIAGTFAF